jgi:hypothetical protein
MIMKKTAVTLFAAMAMSAAVPAFAQLIPPPPAPANTSASNASVRALLDAMHYRETVVANNKAMSEQLLNVMRSQGEASIRNNPKLDDAARKAEMAKMEKQLPKAVAAVQGVLTDPKVVEEMYAEAAGLYARYFTPQEMDQLAAFYRSPTGQKTLNVMPQLTAESMKMAQKIVGPRMQAALQQAKQ